jgi:hypothetical protein
MKTYGVQLPRIKKPKVQKIKFPKIHEPKLPKLSFGGKNRRFDGNDYYTKIFKQ